MIKIKIIHDQYYVSYAVDEKKCLATKLEENDDDYLKAIFSERNDYSNLESWISSRVGNKDFNSAINIIKMNQGRSVKDHLYIEVTDLRMNLAQVKAFFIDKENTPCPLTNELIASGYKQETGGYVNYLRNKGWSDEQVYNQYNHLFYSWVEQWEGKQEAPFGKSITCGELIFWMAEVSQAVSEKELIKLKDYVLEEFTTKKQTRGQLNKVIQDVCFDKIVNTVLNAIRV